MSNFFGNNKTIDYKYKFRFSDGSEKDFDIKLDGQTMDLITEHSDDYPEWTELENFKCSICKLKEEDNKYCPVIISLFDVIEFFRESISHEVVDVIIESKERLYSKQTSLQRGLNSLMGIYMVTSGCPILEKLKPMVRFHLPFSTVDETSFRIISMYLFAQYFIYKNGGKPDWDLKELINVYNDVRVVNKNFCDKLSKVKVQDATINAFVTLDCFAFSISYFIDEDKLDKIKLLFEAYLN
ncbi:DUF6901 family protein [Elusimicrobiota bacterium]